MINSPIIINNTIITATISIMITPALSSSESSVAGSGAIENININKLHVATSVNQLLLPIKFRFVENVV